MGVEIACPGPVDEVGQVKIGNVVAGNDVGVDLLDKVFPGEEEGLLGWVGEDLSTYDLGTGVNCEDVTDEGFRRACFMLATRAKKGKRNRKKRHKRDGGSSAALGRGEIRTISSNDISNLNNRISRSFRKYTRTPGTFNIETEHPQRGNPSPFPFGDMRYDFLIRDLTFDLTVGDFCST